MEGVSGPCGFDVEMSSSDYRKTSSRLFTADTSSWELKEIIWFSFLKRNASGTVNAGILAFVRCTALLPGSLSTSLLWINLQTALLYRSYVLAPFTFGLPGPSVLILSLRCFLALNSGFIIDFELTTLFFEFPHFPLFYFSGSSRSCSYIILVLGLGLSSWHA